MNLTMENLTQPRAAACPDCGRPAELPTITPELLHFECYKTKAPQPTLIMPNGDLVFAHRGHIYAMPPECWLQFEQMREAA